MTYCVFYQTVTQKLLDHYLSVFFPHFIVLAGGQIFSAARELKNKQIVFHFWLKFGLILIKDVAQVLPGVHWVN